MNTQQLADVRVIHRFTAPADRVYDAWLDPDAIGRWLLATSPDDDVIHIQRDPHVGGKFSFMVRRAGQEIDHVGEYRELVRPRRLVFTFDAVGGGPVQPATDQQRITKPGVVTVELAEIGTGTELVLSHEGVPPELRDATRRGWAAILDTMAGITASGGGEATGRGVPLPRPIPNRAARSSR
jgi:uncharacterized protein YndB with AHSA1/START domain